MKKLKFISFLMVGALLALCACKKGGEPDKPVTGVTDACGKTYSVVKMGNQYWMAENMACDKYSINSEQKGATLKVSDEQTVEPYYVDARDAKFDYSVDLTDEQRKHLGLLYNWAAAMGFATAEEAMEQEGEYSGVRQGICPDNWHIPSYTEWVKLYDYVYYEENLYSNEVGEYLKTTTGWFNKGNGNDIYGFSALPAGYAEGSKNIYNVGKTTEYWSVSSYNTLNALDRTLSHETKSLHNYYDYKSIAISVRCVMDNQ